MDLSQALTALEQAGTAGNRKVYVRHGARAPLFGVAFADLDALQKRIGHDQVLAQRLWDSGNHDARVLATLIADPKQMTEPLLELWLHDASNRPLATAFATLAGRSPAGAECAFRWIDELSEWRCAAGWATVAIVAADAGRRDREFAPLLPRIERTIQELPNYARHCANSCLIAIGGRPGLRSKALAVARKVGVVAVDHGKTGGKTPLATEYIDKPAARSATGAGKGRKAVAGARAATGGKTAGKVTASKPRSRRSTGKAR